MLVLFDPFLRVDILRKGPFSFLLRTNTAFATELSEAISNFKLSFFSPPKVVLALSEFGILHEYITTRH